MASGDVTTEVVNGVFRMTVTAPCILRLHPQYQEMVWNECLRLAHEHGHVPVGPILVTDEDLPQEQSLREGEPMRINRPGGLPVQPGMMRITAEVELGASLGGS